jgi:hypothetical protein
VGLESLTENPMDSVGNENVPMPGAINLPEGLPEAKLLDMCQKQEGEFADYSKDDFKEIEDNARLYLGKQAAGITESAGPVIPLTTSIVDTQQARTMGQYFAQEKFFDLLPDGKSALMGDIDGQPVGDVASQVEDFLNERIYDTPDFFQRMDKGIRNLLIERVLIGRVRGEEEATYSLQVGQGQLGQQSVVTGLDFQAGTRVQPVFDVDSVRSYAWDPRCNLNLRRAKWVRHRTNIPTSQLDEWAQKGIIDPKAAEKAKRLANDQQTAQGSLAQDAKDPAAQYVKRVDGKNLPSGAWKDGLVTVDEWEGYICWGEGDQVQSGEFVWWLVPDRQVLLKFEPNEAKQLKRPYAMTIIGQRGEGLQGHGPVDIVKPLINKISNVLGAIAKLMWQAANVPTYYEPVSMLDGRRTILQDANLVPVMNSKAINRAEPPTASIRLLQDYLNFLIQQAREATASNEQAQGIGGGTDTATEAQILAQSSGARTQYQLNLVNAEFFAQLAELYLAFFREHGVPGEMVTREAGVDGNPVEITPQMLALEYKVRPLSAIPQSNKLARFRELSGLLEKVAAIPPNMLTDAQGTPMKVNLYEFLTNDILPLIDVRGGQRLFTRMQAMPMMGPGMDPASQMMAEQALQQTQGLQAPPPEFQAQVQQEAMAGV